MVIPTTPITLWLIILIFAPRDPIAGALDLFDTTSCGKDKGCLLKPSNCVSNSSASGCMYALSYKPAEGGIAAIDFEVQAKGAGDGGRDRWVALGISKEGKMPNTAVTACVWVTRQNRPRLIMHYNEGYTTRRIQNPFLEGDMVHLKEGGISQDNLICRFRQQIYPSQPDPEVFNLTDLNYLVIATGNSDATDANNIDLRAHDMNQASQTFPLVSEKPVDLTQISMVSSGGAVPQWVKPILFKCHGILMIFGWWLFVPTAILFARYFKNMWPTKTLFGVKIWFHLHRGLQIFAVMQIIAAFVCVLVAEEGRWIGEQRSRTHAVCGLTAVIAAFFEPVFALFRCHPGTRWRPLFTWPHRLIGLTAFCVASTTIWYATYFKSMGLNSDAGQGLMIFYWVVVCAVALALEIHITITERFHLLKPKNKTADVAMQGMSGPSAYNAGTTPSQPYYSHSWAVTRGLLVGFFILCAVGVTVALASLIGTTTSTK